MSIHEPTPTTCPHGERGGCLNIRCGSDCTDEYDRMHPCPECAIVSESLP